MIVEFRGLQKREWRVNLRKAGRLTLSSAMSAGDAYDLRDDGYHWRSRKDRGLLSLLSASLGPFSFTRSAGATETGTPAGTLDAALLEECTTLPVGLPAASASGDYVPVVHAYARENAVFWMLCGMVCLADGPSLFGTTSAAVGDSVKVYAAVLVACLALHSMGCRLLTGAVGAMVSGTEVLHALTNGAFTEDRLKLLLRLQCLIGGFLIAGLMVCAASGCGVPGCAAMVPLLYARHIIHGYAHAALMWHLSAAPARRGAPTRADGLGTSLADLHGKFEHAQRSVLAVVLLLLCAVGPCVPPAALRLGAAVGIAMLGRLSSRTVAAVVRGELNPARLELCLTAFYDADSRGGAEVTISPSVVNAWESAWVLPACIGPLHVSAPSALERLLHLAWARLPSLKVHIRVGAALSAVLESRVGVTARAKQDLIQGVSEELQTRGVALVYDRARFVYYVLLPEVYSCDGHPLSWSSLRVAAGESTVGSRAREVPEEGPRWDPIARRVLWAYFYAYSHQRAAGFEGSTATAPPIPPQPGTVNGGGGAAPLSSTPATEGGVIPRSTSPFESPLHVVRALRADGVLDESVAEEVCEEGAEPVRSSLQPTYERFVALLERQGWNLDRFLVAQEGFTVSVMYL